MRAISNGSGSIVQTYTTDAFGVPTKAQGTSAQPFEYTGEQQDAESGFVYMRARVYDPTIGRFLQRDPLAGQPGVPLTLHRFIYANNNPVTLVDPSGFGAEDSQQVLQDERTCYDPDDRRLCGAPVVIGPFLIWGIIKDILPGGDDVVRQGGRKVVVIGESMRDRVIPYAKSIGAKYYKVGKGVPDKNWLKNNRAWIQKQMREGAIIIDIGPDVVRRMKEGPSKYYEMERAEIRKRGYEFYIEDFQ